MHTKFSPKPKQEGDITTNIKKEDIKKFFN